VERVNNTPVDSTKQMTYFVKLLDPFSLQERFGQRRCDAHKALEYLNSPRRAIGTYIQVLTRIDGHPCGCGLIVSTEFYKESSEDREGEENRRLRPSLSNFA